MSIPAMHIPDGFLSLPVALVGWLGAVILIVLALRQTRESFGERQVPMMGILAAFIFAAQMINFPVAGGTSGHLLGGALAAILMGPWAAVLIMTSVIGIQALLFQDGGLLALGFNIINMGILTGFVAYAVYRWIQRLPGKSRLATGVAAFVAGWVSVELAAIATALELALSGTSPIHVALPAMAGVHALIGIGEGLITTAAVLFVKASRPDLVPDEAPAHTPATAGYGWIAVGLVITLAVTLLSPLASPAPDGLERVAEDHGFIEAAEDAPYEILPDYTVPFIENEALTTIVAGIIGALLVFAVALAVAKLRAGATRAASPGSPGSGD